MDYTDEGRFQFFRFEAERAGFALVGDSPAGVDQVDTVGPSRVLAFGRIAEFVQHRGKFYSQLSYASARNGTSFFFILGAGEDHLIFYVALHLPDVAGVRFRDVHHQKCDLAAVLLVEFVEGGDLPPERRSGVASKDQHHGLSLDGKF